MARSENAKVIFMPGADLSRFRERRMKEMLSRIGEKK
jgi:hypothetical protein